MDQENMKTLRKRRKLSLLDKDKLSLEEIPGPGQYKEKSQSRRTSVLINK